MTLQEMIDRGVEQVAPMLPQGFDAEGAAEAMLPQVFHEAAGRFSDAGKSLPRLTKTLSFTNGTATLSDDVLTGSMAAADLYDPDDPTKIYALVPAWEDFIRVYDTRIGYFTVRGGHTVYVIEPGSRYVQGAGITDTLTLVVAGVPAIPGAAGTAIDAPREFQIEALNLLVEKLKGVAVPA